MDGRIFNGMPWPNGRNHRPKKTKLKLRKIRPALFNCAMMCHVHFSFYSRIAEPESEDCLFLNVFVPSTIKPDDRLAVMVWIHGGGFSYQSSTDIPGGILASFNDVIVVTFNYRLGILGFFNIPDTEIRGNYGMFDQVHN